MDLEPEIDYCYDTFMEAGGLPGEWNNLFLRADLTGEELERVEAGEPREKFQHLFAKVMKPGDLILYDVLDPEAVVMGSALGRILEVMRTSKGETLLKIWFLESQDDQYRNWAREAFNERQDFLLHLCATAASDCKSKTKSKKIGWAHTDGWRLCSYRSASRMGWCGQVAVQEFRAMLERWMSLHEESLKRRRSERGREKADDPDELGLGDDRVSDPEVGAAEHPLKDVAADDGERSDKEDRPGEGRGARREGEPSRPRAEDDGPKGFLAGGASGALSEEALAKKAGRRAAEAMKGRSPQLIAASHKASEPVRTKKDAGERKLAQRDREPHHHRGRGGGEAWMEVIPGLDDKKEAAGGSAHGEKKRKRRREEEDSRSEDYPPKKEEPDRRGRGDFLVKKPENEEKSGRRKRRKRKEKKRSTSSSRSRTRGEESSEGSLYGTDKAKHTPLAEKARRHPGRLLRSGLEEMGKYLARRLGEGDKDVGVSWREQRVGAYVSQVLLVQHPLEKMGPRNAREIQTLSMALDALLDGEYALCGDYLMQRLKAVESSMTDGWRIAEHQELVPPARASLTSSRERTFAARQAVAAQRLDAVVKKRTSG